ncbi:asparagine synthase (glutamine-hydrolyzing) [Haloarculaceae archaeon H-GB1-1]|nr:asparagine synthase (glutamine-hydrolyzing) [Haloarculaceae archaeon H-GB1-1]
MCGIVGRHCPAGVDADGVRKLRDELRHRGPDGKGLYTNETDTVALGHRRLSVIDLSDAGSQPMPNESEDVWLVYNGEIYNFRDLREELEACGHTFRSETDSEVIIHGYEEWGIDCVDRFRGMFAFGLWDESEHRFILSRDRLGIKPLYYYHADDQLLFASEPKAVVTAEDVPAKVDPTGLFHYLKYRFVPAPYTIYQDVSKVEPGTVLVFEDGTLDEHRYWDAADHRTAGFEDIENAISELRSDLEDAVTSHLVSDVPLAVLLSGGMDSSTVTAFASAEAEDLRTVSIGMEQYGKDELDYARLVASEYDLDQTERQLDPEMVDEMLPDLLYHYDEPLADPSILPTFLLMQSTSKETKVALSGAGGDELFAGYRWYDRFAKYESLPRGSRSAARLCSPVARWLTSTFQSSWLEAQSTRIDLLSSAPWERYLKLMTEPFSDAELSELFGEAIDFEAIEDDVVRAQFTDDPTVRDQQFVDLNTFLVDDILTKVDRASMAHSLEIRVPFVDHEFVENVLSAMESFPFEGEQKRILKRIGEDVIPEAVCERDKQGFGVPVTQFIDRYMDVLTDSVAAADGILDQAVIETYTESDTADSKQFKLILFELWYRRWIRNHEEVLPRKSPEATN